MGSFPYVKSSDLRRGEVERPHRSPVSTACGPDSTILVTNGCPERPEDRGQRRLHLERPWNAPTRPDPRHRCRSRHRRMRLQPGRRFVDAGALRPGHPGRGDGDPGGTRARESAHRLQRVRLGSAARRHGTRKSGLRSGPRSGRITRPCLHFRAWTSPGSSSRSWRAASMGAAATRSRCPARRLPNGVLRIAVVEVVPAATCAVATVNTSPVSAARIPGSKATSPSSTRGRRGSAPS